MRLAWSRTSRAEDRIDKWMIRHHQELVLAGETTPSGPCPDELFLNDLARKSKRVVLSDPRVDHAATCPTCMKKLLEMRRSIRSRRHTVVSTLSIVSFLILAVLFVVAVGNHIRQRSTSTTAVISQTIDLWNAGTTRGGQTSSLPSVSLPAAFVRATVVLPAFSPPGQYLITITRTQNGEGVLAQVQTTTESVNNQERVHVDLDLRKVKTGKYFLSTTQEQDQAAYYYPVEIK
jgi:hypothetical protein